MTCSSHHQQEYHKGTRNVSIPGGTQLEVELPEDESEAAQ